MEVAVTILDGAQEWAMPISAFLFFMYPVALLAWTAVEGQSVAKVRNEPEELLEVTCAKLKPVTKEFVLHKDAPSKIWANSRYWAACVVVALAGILPSALCIGRIWVLISVVLSVVIMTLAWWVDADDSRMAPKNVAPYKEDQRSTVDAWGRLAYALYCYKVGAGRKRSRGEETVDLETLPAWTRIVARASWTEAVARRTDPGAEEAILVVMVGLPARGKSYISGALVRHLRLLGVRACAFNAGELRRSSGHSGVDASFFAAGNVEAKTERDRFAMECTDSAVAWISKVSTRASVAILDATNSNMARRRAILERCAGAGVRRAQVIFLESVCNDALILEGNYLNKLTNDDYKVAVDATQAYTDFCTRVRKYEEQYEPLHETELLEAETLAANVHVGCIRVFDGGKRMECLQLGSSYVVSCICTLLQSMRLAPKRIILTMEPVDPKTVVAYVQKLQQQAIPGQRAQVLCGASKNALLMASRVDLLLSSVESSQECRRSVLTLRGLEPRRLCADSVHRESFEDLARRMRDVLLLIERSPAPVLVICPCTDVRRVVLSHFCDLPRETSFETMGVACSPSVELIRDHKGFSMHPVTERLI